MTIAQVVRVRIALRGERIQPHLRLRVLVGEGHHRRFAATRPRTLSCHASTLGGRRWWRVDPEATDTPRLS